MQTFFDGSPLETVATLLEQESRQLTDDDFDHLENLIEDARSREKR